MNWTHGQGPLRRDKDEEKAEQHSQPKGFLQRRPELKQMAII